MIQRIQSLWLLLSATCAGITWLVPTFAGNAADGSTKIFSVRESVLLLFLIAFIAVCSFVNIFFFQNRKRQKSIIIVTSIATIGFIAAQFFIVREFKSTFRIPQGNWEISAILPIFVLLFQVFAFIGIRKDEKLLSSADRMR
jgi:amino acid transporter